MHRFLRTCRNKGGTWPAQGKKKVPPGAHTGVESEGQRGRRRDAFVGVKLLSPARPTRLSLFISHFRAGTPLRISARGSMNYNPIRLCFVLAHLWAYVEKLSAREKEWSRANLSALTCCVARSEMSDGSKTRWNNAYFWWINILF